MTKNIEEFSSLLDKHFSKSKKSKLSIGMKVSDEIYRYNWNISNEENNISFGIGSISKTLISTYICYMIEKKTIDLDNRIDDYIELKSNIKYPKIINLLTHTSGYYFYVPLFRSLFVLMSTGFSKKNLYYQLDSKWLVRSLQRIKPLRCSKYRYSDYNYAVLALIIEKIEKRPFQEVITDFIQNEIHMNDTFFGTRNTTENNPHSWLWEDDNPYVASGGVFSTVNDMLKFLEYQIKNKDNLSVSHTKYYKTDNKKNIYTGFTWNAFKNGKFYWHLGGQGYYRSYALFDVKREISIIILSTIDVNAQHVSRLGSSLYRSIKRNNTSLQEFLQKGYDYV